MLATLNRYLGVAVLATGVLCIVLLAAGSSRRRLAARAVVHRRDVPCRRDLAGHHFEIVHSARPISFSENFDWFSRSILEWFIEPQM